MEGATWGWGGEQSWPPGPEWPRWWVSAGRGPGRPRGSLFYSKPSSLQHTYELVPEHRAPPPGLWSPRLCQCPSDHCRSGLVPRFRPEREAAMRTRTLMSDAQDHSPQELPLPLFASKLWGAQEGRGAQISGQRGDPSGSLSHVRLFAAMVAPRLSVWVLGKDTEHSFHFISGG